MTKNKEVDGRCELCGTRGKIKRVRKYGHNWKLCRTCRDDKKTEKKIIRVLESADEKSEIEKASEEFQKIREEEIGIKKEIKEQIDEIDSIIKLVQDLRKDAMHIVERYANMLNDLEEMKLKLLQK